VDQGRIIEEGTHDGLLAEGGHYAELYNTYFRHQSLDYEIPELPEEYYDQELSADEIFTEES
jgi:ATP-binding cassette subfamily B protein